MLTLIDHVGIAVSDLGEAVDRYRRMFGIEPVRERMDDQGRGVLFAVEVVRQLIGALGPDTPVGRFLGKRGPACITSGAESRIAGASSTCEPVR
jgi:methylmalonyl-CoA/ethylmalonyl-CoA epimerase